jgi:hypothetical protein
MTVLMITVWLALQIPAGILFGRMLHCGPAQVSVRTGRRTRR